MMHAGALFLSCFVVAESFPILPIVPRVALRSHGFLRMYTPSDDKKTPNSAPVVAGPAKIRNVDFLGQSHVPSVKSEEAIIAMDALKKAGINKFPNVGSEASFYRLPEWFVVEISQTFASFLLHDAYYCFPWLQQITLYWSLVATIVASLVETRGILVLCSLTSLQGLVMDVSCGVVISIVFLQLWLISVPIRLLMGSAGSASDPAEVEHLLVVTPSAFHRSWERVDDRIMASDACSLDPNDSSSSVAQMLTVPRFAPFTEILAKLAKLDDADRVQLLQVTGNVDNLAAKVIINSGEESKTRLWLDQLPGCEVLRVYEHGWATQEDYAIGRMQHHAILRVDIAHLLRFVKECMANEDIDITSFPACQVYHTFTF